MSTPEYRMRVETEAVRAVLASLAELTDSADEGLVLDTIEGNTNLFEAIDGVLDRIAATEAMLDGLKLVADRYALRRNALKARIERLRAVLEQALVIAEVSQLQRPAATLTMHKVKPKLIVEDPAAIPSRFYRQPPAPPPEIDEKALKAALDAGNAIPGARLSQGGVGLTIRRN